jgi:hypothetical protein
MMRITPTGDVLWEDHFSTIGTGGPIAEAFLVQREYDDFMPLDECLYRVYEAKVAAEKNRDVGPTTVLEVLTYSGHPVPPERHAVHDSAFNAIDKTIRNRLSKRPQLPRYKQLLDLPEDEKKLYLSEEARDG